jgi:hypothetical protein
VFSILLFIHFYPFTGLGFQQFTQFAYTITDIRHSYYECSPIALDVGKIAAEIILFPYSRDPEIGSLTPSKSTGGFAINAIIKTEVATSRHGIIRTPNQPTYKRLSVDVTQLQNWFQRLFCF